jgi:AraC family L-rhamnose operon transcriptional activator RhaR
MKRYQPLVLQTLNIRIPGLRIRKLELHRHLPETEDVAPHFHPFCQSLLYLSGRGVQNLAGRTWTVGVGTLVFIPARVLHSFHRQDNRRPICLVLDFDWSPGGRLRPRLGQIPEARLHEARQLLARIAHLTTADTGAPPLRLSALVLSLLECLLAGIVLPPGSQREFHSPMVRRINGILAQPGANTIPLSRLAREAGFQRDYLNRVLKQQHGLTLGQWRAQKLLQQAERSLARPGEVGQVAASLGFNDPNYFARWFRKHTGLSPSAWRKRPPQAHFGDSVV